MNKKDDFIKLSHDCRLELSQEKLDILFFKHEKLMNKLKPLLDFNSSDLPQALYTLASWPGRYREDFAESSKLDPFKSAPSVQAPYFKQPKVL